MFQMKNSGIWEWAESNRHCGRFVYRKSDNIREVELSLDLVSGENGDPDYISVLGQDFFS
jgi:hypothetical protein